MTNIICFLCNFMYIFFLPNIWHYMLKVLYRTCVLIKAEIYVNFFFQSKLSWTISQFEKSSKKRKKKWEKSVIEIELMTNWGKRVIPEVYHHTNSLSIVAILFNVYIKFDYSQFCLYECQWKRLLNIFDENMSKHKVCIPWLNYLNTHKIHITWHPFRG